MTATIEGRARELLEDKNFATLATLNKEGLPHLAVAWVDVADGTVLLNSAQGRAWPSNLERDPRLVLSVANAENQYEYVEIRGRVSNMTTDGADEHIDSLAKKYLGQDTYPFRQDGEVRVKIEVEPERVRLQGG